MGNSLKDQHYKNMDIKPQMLMYPFEAEYATYGMDSNLFVSKYELYLPNRKELEKLVNSILREQTEEV